jgi:hypothetical protein
MPLDNVYDGTHWEELIETIIQRIGAEEFITVSMAVLYKLKYMELTKPVIMEHIELLDGTTKALNKNKG